MQHFPIFLNLAGRRVIVSGGGECALAKLRLLLKTEARIWVFTTDPSPEVLDLAAKGKITLTPRALAAGDAFCTALFYAANDDDAEDARVIRLARADGALVNWVDNLEASEFITPAIVDRDPVTIAIGTEGAAPVLARRIKRDLEERLSPALGIFARVAKSFRPKVEALTEGAARRGFWARYYDQIAPRIFAVEGEAGLRGALETLLTDSLTTTVPMGEVLLVGAGPGDPELLTLRARKALDEAEVVIHDRLISPQILELARREAVLIDAGKTGFGPAMRQEDICALMVGHARRGAKVVRLKAGDPGVYGRLDDEIDSLNAADTPWSIIPGITAASAAAAQIGQSLTKRGRNSALRFLTGHDVAGFAEHDWRGLARSGEVAAIYMGKRGARFIQGRLLMHGARPDTPVTVVEHASRVDTHVIDTDLANLALAIEAEGKGVPAVILYGLPPRAARTAHKVTKAEIAL
jgi:uroporphyrin-III C-methyltransferase/precorrin-2 dehydrogenase/sirohydrochlorin ferrochelatase